MGELIRLAEIDHERRRGHARLAERTHLERALEHMKRNLAQTAAALLDEADLSAQSDMVRRLERLAAMVRYGLRMLGEKSFSERDDPRSPDHAGF